MANPAAAIARLLPVPPRQLPPPDSLAFYALLAAVGVVGAVEWPALLLAAVAQGLVDRRAGELKARLSEQSR